MDVGGKIPDVAKKKMAKRQVDVGLGRNVASYYRSSASYHIRYSFNIFGASFF
jgi:hypothetical protein